MLFLNDLVTRIEARLPELEWMLKTRHIPLNRSNLPRGLFYDRFEMTLASCIEEIKFNLMALKQETHERSARFLAERVQQKINVLVGLYQLHGEKKTPNTTVHFGVQTISTRQQWVESLDNEMAHLAAQKQALQRALERMQTANDGDAMLRLQAELGELERRLTLAKETWNRMTSL